MSSAEHVGVTPEASYPICPRRPRLLAAWSGAIRRLDAPALVGLLALIGAYLALIGMLGARGYDPTVFVVAGGELIDPTQVPRGLTVPPVPGYDGIAFCRLALDPFPTQQKAFTAVRERQWRLRPLLPYAVPLMTYLVLELALWGVWGTAPLLEGGGNFGGPFGGLRQLRGQLSAASSWQASVEEPLAAGAFLGGTLLLVLASLHSSRAELPIKAAWSMYAIAALFLTQKVWGDGNASMRALSDASTLSAIIVLRSAWPLRALLLGSSGLGGLNLARSLASHGL